MRDNDLRRVCDLLYWHKTGKRNRATRTFKDEFSLIRFAAYAIPILAHHGYIDHAEEDEG